MNSNDIFRILFVENTLRDVELTIQEIRASKLNFSSMRVDTETDFLVALESYKPNIIISNYSLPSFDGMQALAISKRRDYNLPFIILTSTQDELTAVSCMKAGADDYILKEQLFRLPSAISKALGKSKEGYAKEKSLQLLSEREAQYRAIFNDSAAIILLFNPESLAIVDANDAAAGYYGLPREELIGKSLMQFYVFDEVIIRDYVEKILSSGRMHFAFRHRRADGELRNVDAFAGRLLLNSRTFIHLWVYDVTEKVSNEARLRALTIEMTKIEERERKKFALYLHDEIGQKLAFLKMRLEALSMMPGVNIPGNELGQIVDLLDQTILQARSMVMDLSPTVLYKLGFVAGLRYEGETICRKVGLKFIFFDSGSQISLDDNKEILVFRCVQELMRNVVKHAKATEMRLSIRMVGNRVEIALYDNGIGFDPSAHKAQITHPGFGLFSVQERISGIKGNVEIESKIGVGTRIALVLPLD